MYVMKETWLSSNVVAQNNLTAPEHAALAEAARLGGKRWKARLREAWANGTLRRLVGWNGPVETLHALRTKPGFDLGTYQLKV